MVGTILPIGYGERRAGRPPYALTGYAVGSVLGGVAGGAVAAAIGAALYLAAEQAPASRLAGFAAGAIGIAYGLGDAGVARVPRYRTRRQVPSHWYKTKGSFASAFLYGTGLSVGLLTHLPHAGFFAVAVWCVLSGSPLASVLAWVCFGLGRFAALPLVGVETGSGGAAVERTLDRLAEWGDPVAVLVGGAGVAAGSFLLVAAATAG